MEDVEIDDEVFVEKTSYSRTEHRSRHLSDCIDSVGDSFNVHRHSFSEFSAHVNQKIDQSPPSTPDLGYYSPGPSSYICKPLWFRCSTTNSFRYSIADETDAGGFVESPRIETDAISYVGRDPNEFVPSPNSVYSGRREHRVATMRVEKHSEQYNMDHPRRGLAVILNNDTFASSLPDREGSKFDVKNLDESFKRLGFEVEIYNNLSHQKIKNLLDTLADKDHTDADCFALVVLTHGLNSNLLWSHDFLYETDILWTSFIPSRCPTLAGKPKLFFIQACRGDRLDPGVQMISQTQHDSGSTSYKLPNHADFLIAFSTTAGMYSFRNAEKGTWFIQSLCSELREFGTKEDFLHVMIRVLRRVALDFESYNVEIPIQHGQKQMPMMHCMLIRDIFFKPKSQEAQNVDELCEKLDNGCSCVNKSAGPAVSISRIAETEDDSAASKMSDAATDVKSTT